MIYFLFAMEREAKMLEVPNKKIIGINGNNMPFTTDDDILVNIGYCGGYKIPVGTIIEPAFAIDAKTYEIARIDRLFNIPSCLCVTSDKFVEEPVDKEMACVYDMELFKVAQIPHKKLYAVKIVSDNLDEAACEAFNSESAWKNVQRMINKFIKENM